MSIELEVLKFPKKILLKDDFQSTLRPLKKDDEKKFHQFFLEVPAEERMSLYERTIATLRTTCAHSIGSELRDFCQGQASFLSGFPECNSECQRECEKLRPRPTK